MWEALVEPPDTPADVHTAFEWAFSMMNNKGMAVETSTRLLLDKVCEGVCVRGGVRGGMGDGV